MAFKHEHARYRPLVLQTSPDNYLHKTLAAAEKRETVFPSPIIDRWRRQVGKFNNQPRAALTYPHPNGWNDAVTIMCLVDCLLRLEPTSYINAGGLQQMLTEEYEQIMWDPITVGRILGYLARAANNAPATNVDQPMIAVINYGGAKHYVIGADIHTWQWLGQVRELMGREAVHAVTQVRRGNKPKHMPYWEQIEAISRGDHLRAA